MLLVSSVLYSNPVTLRYSSMYSTPYRLFAPAPSATQASGATNMNVPPIGAPKPVASPNALMLNNEIGVEGVTAVCESKPAGCLNSRNTYLCKPKPIAVSAIMIGPV